MNEKTYIMPYSNVKWRGTKLKRYSEIQYENKRKLMNE